MYPSHNFRLSLERRFIFSEQEKSNTHNEKRQNKTKKQSVHNNKATDFIKIMKATIWFTNMLQNNIHHLQI